MSILTPELKAAWIAALRSGQFEQGTAGLKTWDGKVCCLGVLGLIHPDFVSMAGSCKFLSWRFKCSNGFFTTSLPRSILPSSIQEELIHLNDGEQRPFPQIANWIEKNPEI
jgi:hypothetical protein